MGRTKRMKKPEPTRPTAFKKLWTGEWGSQYYHPDHGRVDVYNADAKGVATKDAKSAKELIDLAYKKME